MNLTSYNIAINLLKIICIFIHFSWISSASVEDCEVQIGVPYKVITKTAVYPDMHLKTGDRQTPYPNQPEKLSITPVLNGTGIPGINITWESSKYDSSLKGYVIQLWKYKDPTESNPNTSLLDTCVFYNVSSASPTTLKMNFSYFHTMGNNSKLIKFSPLSQMDGTNKYIHRLVKGFTQDYGDDSAYWKTALFVIHNDSCMHRVHVQVYLAPERFHFTHYDLVLRDINIDEDIMSKPFRKVSSSRRMLDHTFTNVTDGQYTINLYPQPKDQLKRRRKCMCKERLCGHYTTCCPSKTGVFIIKSDHENCRHTYLYEAARSIQSISQIQDSSEYLVFLLIICVMVILLIILLTAGVIACIRFRPKQQTKLDEFEIKSDQMYFEPVDLNSRLLYKRTVALDSASKIHDRNINTDNILEQNHEIMPLQQTTQGKDVLVLQTHEATSIITESCISQTTNSIDPPSDTCSGMSNPSNFMRRLNEETSEIFNIK